MPNRRARRATRHKPTKLPGFQKLPKEVVLELMKVAPKDVHAVLLQTCKSFYSLGLSALYRSIWITSPETSYKLSCSFERNVQLASSVRSFKIMLQSNDTRIIFNWKLDLILSLIRNVEDLQIFVGERQYLMFMSLKFSSFQFPKLRSLTLSLCEVFIESYGMTLDFLGKHPLLEHLCLFRLDLSPGLGHHFEGPEIFQPVHLPILRSFRGPISILKCLATNLPSLSSLVLEISHDDPNHVLSQLTSLSLLENRWIQRDDCIKPGLSVELIVSLADRRLFDLLETAIIHLPSDLEELNICCALSEPAESVVSLDMLHEIR
ncbi:hypothetical protein VKT23_016544 [Stygiomarasmius scandens]|uniref:F-box domain-containing protein n=1 Tax=Marasmiellus scandens TaxID=2682957 RepID=A0ABR1IW74_9AGAR